MWRKNEELERLNTDLAIEKAVHFSLRGEVRQAGERQVFAVVRRERCEFVAHLLLRLLEDGVDGTADVFIEGKNVQDLARFGLADTRGRDEIVKALAREVHTLRDVGQELREARLLQNEDACHKADARDHLALL